MSRKLMIALAIVSGVTIASPVYAQSLQCGLKPLPPVGCKSEKARCICDADGDNCQWEFVCG
jgi:hypothetical protein